MSNQAQGNQNSDKAQAPAMHALCPLAALCHICLIKPKAIRTATKPRPLPCTPSAKFQPSASQPPSGQPQAQGDTSSRPDVEAIVVAIRAVAEAARAATAMETVEVQAAAVEAAIIQMAVQVTVTASGNSHIP
ncbi:hypothetical protein BDR07DRAFT_1485176 [Suillus spraguei]|nr:hypothetical protein BDR07DRAFT_1485176 [Suillus spraguei]